MDDLLEGLKAGRAEAFERLVRDHGDRLYRFVKRMVGTAWAEDTAQEVFLRIHRTVRQCEPTGSFRAWVYTLAHRVCIDFLRKRPARTPATGAAETDPSEAASSAELRDTILRAVERLPEEQRQVFLMREEAELTFREIAEIVGCPINTALGRMHYAVQNLQKELAAHRPCEE